MSALAIISAILTAFSCLLYYMNVRAIRRATKAAQQKPETIAVPVYIPYPVQVFSEIPAQEILPSKDTNDEPYRNPVTPAEQKIIDRLMDELIEEFPNGYLASKNPEYVENYLNRIDLSELDDALGKS
jgi:hypothetical protein